MEDDEMAASLTDVEIDRNLQSLIHLPEFSAVRGIVFGRFQKASEMSIEKLRAIVASKRELKNLPVACNVDFGHTDPYITFPVGGEIKLYASMDEVKIIVEQH